MRLHGAGGIGANRKKKAVLGMLGGGRGQALIAISNYGAGGIAGCGYGRGRPLLPPWARAAWGPAICKLTGVSSDGCCANCIIPWLKTLSRFAAQADSS